VSASGTLDVSRLSIAEIRARIEEFERSEPGGLASQNRDWVASLREDPRSGARGLAVAFTRREELRRRESDRLARLFERRRKLHESGVQHVAGVDEVGVGPLAGPVVAAAVILPSRVDLPGLNDSKRLSPRQRERLDGEIRAQANAVAVAEVSSLEVDRMNVLRASLTAMRRAVEALEVRPDHVLVDAHTIPEIEISQTPIVGGDGRDGSIAAASIVAKVYRDAIMRDLDIRHPGYGFAQHKGYGTQEHLAALARLGPSTIHRHSFAPVAQYSRPG
jgi:ribonuclease HII